MGRASRVLELGGSLLDANASRAFDPAIAKPLFEECLVWTARALGESASNYPEALERLEESGALARSTGDADAARRVLSTLLDRDPTAEEFRAIETVEAKLVEAAGGRRTTIRRERILRWGFIAVLLASVIAVCADSWIEPWKAYKFVTSSAYDGYPQKGALGDTSPLDLLFHTKEELRPWIEVDLAKSRRIHQVVLKNRLDCCKDRGVPLVVEVAGADREYVTVAERDKSFDRWVANFDATEARYVRVRSLDKNILHFRAIEIR